MSRMTVTFRRGDGRTLAIDGTALGLTAASGLDEPNLEVYTQKAALGDGDLVTGQRVGSRTLEFTARVTNPALNDVLRRAVTSFFTAGYAYEVHVSRFGDRRFAADCRLESLSVPVENRYKPITVKIALIMPEGYWLSADSFGRNIASVESRCGYPFISPAGSGRLYGLFAYAGTVCLENDGDAEAYCRAVFIARGEVVHPRLIAGGGQVRVLCTLTAGDVLVIDGKTRAVTLNGENAVTSLDRASDFSGIVFATGTNTISFGADVGSNLLAVNVYYNKRYIGA